MNRGQAETGHTEISLDEEGTICSTLREKAKPQISMAFRSKKEAPGFA
jgi:hypothetical protein